MKRLRVGIVGCGEAAQILHLPSLSFLRDRFDVTALSDVSAQVVDGVGDRWGIRTRTTDPGTLVTRDDVDAVLVAAPDAVHAEIALAALDAGKHVLIEKPMCMTLREADEIEAARRAADRAVQVGYPRPHAPAVRKAAELVRGMNVRLARVHDVLGLNALIIEQTSRVIRGDDVGAETIAEARRSRDRLVSEAIGDVPADVAGAYLLLLSLGCHDVSLMRDLLGVPHGVLYAAAWHGAWYVTGAFDYGSFACQFEIGFDHIPRADTHIEIFGEAEVARVSFDTTMVRNLPVHLAVTRANGEGGVDERTVRPTWGDPFVSEWKAFHRAVTRGEEPRTTPTDFRRDLEVFIELVRTMSRGGHRTGAGP